jgi:preprotein translocase subunit SecF
MELFKTVPNFAFMRTRRAWYVVSAALMVGSLISLGTRGLNLGIDFTGGTVVEAAFPQEPDLDRVRAALGEAGFPEALVQKFGSPRDVMIRMPPERLVAEEPGEASEAGDAVDRRATERVRQTLLAIDPGVELRRVEAIGSQVGSELAEKGALAMLFTLILILIYVMFRFEWKLSMGAVLAAMHDPIIILGVFSLSGLTFDMTVVAAMLATIGYSLNDTVVVFDRARDCFRTMRTSAPVDTMNAAINQTLSRTLITSGATLLVLFVLLLFGGEALRSFSIALIVGIFVGTYSSIYVAGALAVDLKLTSADLMPPKKVEEIDDLP